MHVEIWSDVVCPWCSIGQQRFDRAVAALADEVDLRIEYRPYQLDPTAPLGPGRPVAEAYAAKFGGPERADQIMAHVTSIAADEGLDFRMDRALRANTLTAHRLLWLASATGHQHALATRLFRAYFTEGLDVGSAEVVAQCGADVGMPLDQVRAFLESTDGVDEVRQQIADAGDLGISAVPTYVLDGRWVIPGAQDTATFVDAIRRLIARREHDE